MESNTPLIFAVQSTAGTAKCISHSSSIPVPLAIVSEVDMVLPNDGPVTIDDILSEIDDLSVSILIEESGIKSVNGTKIINTFKTKYTPESSERTNYLYGVALIPLGVLCLFGLSLWYKNSTGRGTYGKK